MVIILVIVVLIVFNLLHRPLILPFLAFLPFLYIILDLIPLFVTDK